MELLFLGWLGCGVVTYAISLAYFQREFRLIAKESYTSDVFFAAAMGFTGPIGLLLSFFCSGFVKHGLKWK